MNLSLPPLQRLLEDADPAGVSRIPHRCGNAYMYAITGIHLEAYADAVAALNLPLEWLLRLFVLRGLFSLGGFLLLYCWCRGVNGEVSRVDGNTPESLALRCIARDNEPFGGNAAAAFGGVAVLNVPGLLRG